MAKEVAAVFSEKNVTFMAGSIAYSAFLSLAPLLLLLLIVVTVVGGGLEDRVVAVAQESLSGPIADVVAEVFQGDAAPSASVVGIVVLVWGALKVFRGLDTAFSEIYETAAETTFVDTVLDALVVLFALVVAVVATVGVTAAFARLSGTVPYIGLMTPLILVVGLVVAFYPLYSRFPDTAVGWRTVLPGVVFAAVGWAAFQSLFQVYLSFAGGGAGSIFGGIVVVITWLYFTGVVLLVGAVVNAVLGGYASSADVYDEAQPGGYVTERRETMSPGELSEYLVSLRDDLTRRPEEVAPVNGAASARDHPLPANGVEIRERSAGDGEEPTFEVSMRWRIDESVAPPDPTGD